MEVLTDFYFGLFLLEANVDQPMVDCRKSLYLLIIYRLD